MKSTLELDTKEGYLSEQYWKGRGKLLSLVAERSLAKWLSFFMWEKTTFG